MLIVRGDLTFLGFSIVTESEFLSLPRSTEEEPVTEPPKITSSDPRPKLRSALETTEPKLRETSPLEDDASTRISLTLPEKLALMSPRVDSSSAPRVTDSKFASMAPLPSLVIEGLIAFSENATST